MTYQQLLKGLKDGSITIKNQGHLTNSLIEKIEHNIKIWKEAVKEYKDIIAGKIPNKEGRKSDPKRMLELYEERLNNHLEIGRYLEGEQYCFHCDSTMYYLLVDEKTIAYVDSRYYWERCEQSGNKYEYVFKPKDIKICAASDLVKVSKLTSTINFPTGDVAFVNHYGKTVDDLPKKEKYSRPGLNSVLGRNRIMQYLANQNIGYGQMGNMSIGIYSNDKDEIIVGSDYFKDKIADTENYLNGKYGKKPTGEDLKRCQKKLKDAKKFDALLKKGNFKLKGSISLSVWRWMCADVSIKKTLKGEDNVRVKLQAGKYQIEHYYDFPKNGDFLYSRLKLIS